MPRRGSNGGRVVQAAPVADAATRFSFARVQAEQQRSDVNYLVVPNSEEAEYFDRVVRKTVSSTAKQQLSGAAEEASPDGVAHDPRRSALLRAMAADCNFDQVKVISVRHTQLQRVQADTLGRNLRIDELPPEHHFENVGTTDATDFFRAPAALGGAVYRHTNIRQRPTTVVLMAELTPPNFAVDMHGRDTRGLPITYMARLKLHHRRDKKQVISVETGELTEINAFSAWHQSYLDDKALKQQLFTEATWIQAAPAAPDTAVCPPCAIHLCSHCLSTHSLISFQ